MSPRLRRDRKHLPDWIMMLHLFSNVFLQRSHDEGTNLRTQIDRRSTFMLSPAAYANALRCDNRPSRAPDPRRLRCGGFECEYIAMFGKPRRPYPIIS